MDEKSREDATGTTAELSLVGVICVIIEAKVVVRVVVAVANEEELVSCHTVVIITHITTRYFKISRLEKNAKNIQ